MNVDGLRQLESSRLQHGGPEERVEVGDVLADEVVNLAIGIAPPSIERFAGLVTPFLRGCDVTDRRIEPDVEKIARRVGNFDPEIRCRSRDIPITKRVREKGPLQPVRRLGRHSARRLGPLVEELVEGFELHE